MKRINQYLTPRLQALCDHALQLQELNQVVSNYLPQSLHKHCKVGSFKAGCLVLMVTDAVWVTELRYLIPSLRDSLRQDAGLYQLASIKIKITTPESISLKENGVPSISKISMKSRKTIVECGEQCHYEPLRKALNALARNK